MGWKHLSSLMSEIFLCFLYIVVWPRVHVQKAFLHTHKEACSEEQICVQSNVQINAFMKAQVYKIGNSLSKIIQLHGGNK